MIAFVKPLLKEKQEVKISLKISTCAQTHPLTRKVIYVKVQKPDEALAILSEGNSSDPVLSSNLIALQSKLKKDQVETIAGDQVPPASAEPVNCVNKSTEGPFEQIVMDAFPPEIGNGSMVTFVVIIESQAAAVNKLLTCEVFPVITAVVPSG